MTALLAQLSFFFTGAVLGASAGLSPGPLQTLVVSETLKYDAREGAKVCVAPLITDPPIIIITLLALSRLSDFDPVLGVISTLGGLFLAFLAYENIRKHHLRADHRVVGLPSLRKAIITNFLSPMPYIFWFFVAAPTVVKAFHTRGVVSAALFIVAFYLFLTGMSVVIALVVARTKSLLNRRGYTIAMRVLGLLLLVFSIIFMRNGLKLMGVV